MRRQAVSLRPPGSPSPIGQQLKGHLGWRAARGKPEPSLPRTAPGPAGSTPSPLPGLDVRKRKLFVTYVPCCVLWVFVLEILTFLLMIEKEKDSPGALSGPFPELPARAGAETPPGPGSSGERPCRGLCPARGRCGSRRASPERSEAPTSPGWFPRERRRTPRGCGRTPSPARRDTLSCHGASPAPSFSPAPPLAASPPVDSERV